MSGGCAWAMLRSYLLISIDHALRALVNDPLTLKVAYASVPVLEEQYACVVERMRMYRRNFEPRGGPSGSQTRDLIVRFTEPLIDPNTFYKETMPLLFIFA
jgi:hypothetical protein